VLSVKLRCSNPQSIRTQNRYLKREAEYLNKPLNYMQNYQYTLGAQPAPNARCKCSVSSRFHLFLDVALLSLASLILALLPSSATALRSSSSFVRMQSVNLAERSWAPIRSFNIFLASDREKLLCFEPTPPSSDNEELQAVLSVHSVPQRDSRSSLTLGLPSPEASMDFMASSARRASTASTARRALSMAEMVLAACWLVSVLLLLLVRGLGMYDNCEAGAIVGDRALWQGMSPLCWLESPVLRA